MSQELDPQFTNPISQHIWQTKYRFCETSLCQDQSVSDTWQRVATALASIEAAPDRDYWESRFRHLLGNFRFLPGGRILAGAGTNRRVTLFNCFVMGVIPDSIEGIFESLKEGAITLQQGGGIGYDFSTLRPADSLARSTGNIASGPVSFLHVWDAAAATIQSYGQRRGAMMATLRCDHPDIMKFVTAKSHVNHLSQFNLSVLITDEFMQAVDQDRQWELVFPEAELSADQMSKSETVIRRWPGYRVPPACRIFATISAKHLWHAIAEAAANSGDPGVLFIDTINHENNLYYRETISATNPCGEIPLPPYGACNLGSFNLTAFIKNPFSASARFDFDALYELVPVAVRLLDNAVDASLFPLPEQAARAHDTRRLGIGVTGFADALIMLGMDYRTDAARAFATHLFAALRDTAYTASVELARQRSPFPEFRASEYLKGAFVRRLPAGIRRTISAHGIRNSHLLAVAPTGTISILANNISSGIEPVIDFRMRRKIQENGQSIEYPLTDYAVDRWSKLHHSKSLPPAFIVASKVSPIQQLKMLSVMQPYIDNSISKTVNLPHTPKLDEILDIFHIAYTSGLKGCTVFPHIPHRYVIRPDSQRHPAQASSDM